MSFSITFYFHYGVLKVLFFGLLNNIYMYAKTDIHDETSIKVH